MLPYYADIVNIQRTSLQKFYKEYTIMIGKIFGIFTMISLIAGIMNGTLPEVAAASVSGAAGAVSLTLTLLGMMGLWCGLMRVAQATGATALLARLLSPLLRILFPDAWKRQNGIAEIASSMTANILGIGNAATPLAVAAMKKLSENAGGSETASDDMVTFTVMGTASLDIVPTTLIALRTAAGSDEPFSVLVPVWICSAASAAVGVLLARGLRGCGTTHAKHVTGRSDGNMKKDRKRYGAAGVNKYG